MIMARKSAIQLLKNISNGEGLINKKLQFYNSDGVKKVFDVHHYGKGETILFKKKPLFSIA